MSTQDPDHTHDGAGTPPEGASPEGTPPENLSPQDLPPQDLPPQGMGGRAKLSELDYEADPLARLERNNRSTKQAIMYFFAVPGLAAIIALGTALLSRSLGGPICDAGDATWLCSQGFRLVFHIVPALVCFFGLFGGAYICYYKWKSRQRWRPWIAVIWFIMPIAIGWAVNGAAMLILMN